VIEPYNKRDLSVFTPSNAIFLAVAGSCSHWHEHPLAHPFLGWLVLFLLWPLISLAELILWLF